ERDAVEDEPRIGRQPRHLGVTLERRHNHVIGWHQEEDRKQDQKKIGRKQRRASTAPQARSSRRCFAGRHGESGGAHPISLPRLRTPRRMKTAAIARIGSMNSDVAAPSGRSPERIPSRKAEVAHMGVMFRGPPAVMICTMSKLAKVTISENSTVMAMILRIIGSVMCTNFCQALAPSMSAAS